MVNDFLPLTIFAKHSMLNVWQGSKCTLDYLSCFAVVLKGIHVKVDICQTDNDFHSKLRIFSYSEVMHGSATFRFTKG